MNKKIHVIGNDMFADSFIEECKASGEPFDIIKHESITPEEIQSKIVGDPNTKIVFTSQPIYAHHIRLVGKRKDIFCVSMGLSTNSDKKSQYQFSLVFLKGSSVNLVLAHDVKTGHNMIVAPEETTYHQSSDFHETMKNFVEMTLLRCHLTFTQSTVIAGDPVPWKSDLVPSALRAVVDHCIKRSAYKTVERVTAGHFAVKLDDTTFLTSRRKTNFNHLERIGLVKVETSGPDTVLAYGSKPSVGGQSQRIVFKDHPGYDCIVHFHCPKKPNSKVNTVSQREFECGSHQCGENTSKGLTQYGNLFAVYLDNHGPNILFKKTIDPQEVIDFIEENFDLTEKTGGLVNELYYE